MIRLISSLLLFIFLCLNGITPAQAKEPWREVYDDMNVEEREKFDAKRSEIKTMMNVMSEEERAAFRAQLNSGPTMRNRVVYIEAIPPEVREEFQKIESEIAKDKERSLSLQRKLQLLAD